MFAEMPKYRCHKEVWALKIAAVYDNPAPVNPLDEATIEFEGEQYGPIGVSLEYARKHNPYPGGYYIQYADGYESFSPAEPFESGYTLIK